MAWNEMIIETERDITEALSDAFLDAGALSVSVEDADAGTENEKPLFGEPGVDPLLPSWERARIVVLLAEGADPEVVLSDASKACGLPQAPSYLLRSLAEQDWVVLTQSQFDPIHIGKNIWVVPSWHEAPDKNAIILELDPGLAFGTGSHPTTRLCMEWLEQHLKKGARILDYGCGSGILAIISKKLGAKEVVGVDIDSQAVIAAKENAARNQCEIGFYVPDDFQAPFAQSQFDVVVANILTNPLKLLAPVLVNHVAPGGSLVLSGILEWQAEDVIAAYAPYISLQIWQTSEGWVALWGTLTKEVLKK